MILDEEHRELLAACTRLVSRARGEIIDARKACATSTDTPWVWCDVEDNELNSLCDGATVTMTAGQLRSLLDATKTSALSGHVPCQACGWQQPRPPLGTEEPPIVRGALDAQASAEKALFAAEGELQKIYSFATSTGHRGVHVCDGRASLAVYQLAKEYEASRTEAAAKAIAKSVRMIRETQETCDQNLFGDSAYYVLERVIAELTCNDHPAGPEELAQLLEARAVEATKSYERLVGVRDGETFADAVVRRLQEARDAGWAEANER
jgi:hypothetical protein